MINLFFVLSVMMSCNTGIVTEHRRFDSVFDWYPERLDANVHGYVATANCDDIGKYGLFYVEGSNKLWKVKVADCLAQKDKPLNNDTFHGEWLMDMDMYLFYASGTDRHRIGTLCLFK